MFANGILIVTTLAGSVNLGEPNLKMKQTKVSRNSQLYSGPQTIYVLRVKQGHMSKVHVSSNCVQSQGQGTFM